MAIELNEGFKCALGAIQDGKNVFVTGRAGTGKSTLLEYFRAHTKERIAVLAPTGVAALNVHGVTIHSFFKFKPDITLEKAKKSAQRILKEKEYALLYQEVKCIIIDEVSMVRADVLDCVDAFLRIARKKKFEPFGGCQMIFIGDLYQLPPVVNSQDRQIFKEHYQSPYFFSAHCLENFSMEYIELEKIYRQNDDVFIGLLNAIRNRTVTDDDLTFFNARVQPAFEPPRNQMWISLTPTNDAAQRINEMRLREIKGRTYTYRAHTRGTFDEKQAPTEYELRVKIGSQIMIVNNDANGRWVNGTVARITDIESTPDKPDTIWVTLPDGSEEDVAPHSWDLFSYTYNPHTKSLDTETIGAFMQYPLRLAWAVTIHKSQGKTFDRVIIDMDRGAFAHGQTYVALSRCRTLEGIILKRPIKKNHIILDWRVMDFVTKFQYKKSDDLLSLDKKIAMIQKAIAAGKSLEIVYLKKQDEKSRRIITPRLIDEMMYEGKPFLGMEAYCHARRDMRVFRIDRILEMKSA